MLIVLCGCMPQEEVVVARVLENTRVDIVFGTHNLYRLGEYIYDAYFPRKRSSGSI